MMLRRALLAALPCSAALAQPADRMRRIAFIAANAESDPDAQARAAALRQGLRELGWIEGRNLHITYRWGGGDLARAEAHARELAALAPQLIVSNGTPQLAALQRHMREIPIVFVVVVDPVGAGFVASMARPGGSITGFATYEPELGGKWLDALLEFEPGLRRVGVVTDPDFRGFGSLVERIESLAAPRGIAVRQLHFRRPEDDVEAAIAQFAEGPEAGLVVIPTALNLLARGRIITAAAGALLPAMYPFRTFVDSGGLMSYGFEPLDLFRRSASYVHRILNGERPAELPVQLPTRFEFVVNLQTARALGREMPDMLLARADEVIE
ncbi:ABC transporter substrate-binding protein [Sediminicoccus sp. KRV36]|uniref:ABC transporter substrate-binding protein n=1 Tax=Sediminicoccus sp. KRV36 TaxID=3133721 RepID=UPI00200E1845|nr:ABC transporter substrate-binding protein [Sediminicoccus rosea]UPY38848.1 ABC transporter substrate-binding protein [Sediminicoccus rosea]